MSSNLNTSSIFSASINHCFEYDEKKVLTTRISSFLKIDGPFTKNIYDIYIFLDVSGSMKNGGNFNKLQKAQTFINFLVSEFLNTDNRVSVAAFNNQFCLFEDNHQWLTEFESGKIFLDPSEYKNNKEHYLTKFESRLKSLKAECQTDFSIVCDLIKEKLTENHERYCSGNIKPVILFLTDGYDTAFTGQMCIRFFSDYLESLPYLKIFFGLGFSKDHDSQLLSKIALNNNGFYNYIPDELDILKYSTICDGILKHLKNFSNDTFKISLLKGIRIISFHECSVLKINQVEHMKKYVFENCYLIDNSFIKFIKFSIDSKIKRSGIMNIGTIEIRNQIIELKFDFDFDFKNLENPYSLEYFRVNFYNNIDSFICNYKNRKFDYSFECEIKTLLDKVNYDLRDSKDFPEFLIVLKHVKNIEILFSYYSCNEIHEIIHYLITFKNIYSSEYFINAHNIEYLNLDPEILKEKKSSFFVPYPAQKKIYNNLKNYKNPYQADYQKIEQRLSDFKARYMTFEELEEK